jgi:hypothetical protein
MKPVDKYITDKGSELGRLERFEDYCRENQPFRNVGKQQR